MATTFANTLLTGILWRHAQATLIEIFAGLTIGGLTATFLGYFLAKNKLLEQVYTSLDSIFKFYIMPVSNLQVSTYNVIIFPKY